MTPLARSFFLGALDVHNGAERWKNRLLECQFFEVSQVYDMLWDMAWQVVDGKVPLSMEGLFLPAEPCWIEWQGGQREAVFLSRDGGTISGQHFYGAVKGWIASEDAFELKERSSAPVVHPLQSWLMAPSKNFDDPHEAEFLHCLRAYVVLVLSVINTPRIVGRRQHMPTRRLEAALLKERPPIGKFPKGSWTEILLQVHAPKDMSNRESVEAHLTGTKAMHFCRAHLRVRNGRVELVRGHWRGDASLGVRRSRYIVGSSLRGAHEPS